VLEIAHYDFSSNAVVPAAQTALSGVIVLCSWLINFDCWQLIDSLLIVFTTALIDCGSLTAFDTWLVF
jgi:hypothetical protein